MNKIVFSIGIIIIGLTSLVVFELFVQSPPKYKENLKPSKAQIIYKNYIDPLKVLKKL